MLFFYDTETTDLPDFKAPSGSEHQPHLVQLAAALVDESTRKIVASLDTLISPDGWVSSDKARETHGITEEFADLYGVDEALAIQTFYQMWSGCDMRVAHNESFDARLMRIAFKRYADEDTCEIWKQGKTFCTMRESTSIVKCPPTDRMIAAGRHHYKNPNLGEAYEFFTGKTLEGAHNAMVDVKACIEVYFCLVDLKEMNQLSA